LTGRATIPPDRMQEKSGESGAKLRRYGQLGGVSLKISF
jgi:hypothetical protein